MRKTTIIKSLVQLNIASQNKTISYFPPGSTVHVPTPSFLWQIQVFVKVYSQDYICIFLAIFVPLGAVLNNLEDYKTSPGCVA